MYISFDVLLSNTKYMWTIILTLLTKFRPSQAVSYAKQMFDYLCVLIFFKEKFGASVCCVIYVCIDLVKQHMLL